MLGFLLFFLLVMGGMLWSLLGFLMFCGYDAATGSRFDPMCSEFAHVDQLTRIDTIVLGILTLPAACAYFTWVGFKKWVWPTMKHNRVIVWLGGKAFD